MRVLLGSFLLAGSLLACSGPKPPEAPKPDVPPTDQAKGPARKKSGPLVASEVGALDKDATVRAFGSLLPRVEKCQDERRAKDERLDFLAGDIKLKVRIKADGTVRYAYLAHSTLGDAAVESCIVEAAKRVSWPKPEGGEGIAENELSLPMKGDRDAVAWAPEKVVKEVSSVKAQLASCRAGKSGAFAITAYVDKDGQVISAGASAPVEDADAVVDCLLKTIKSVKMPSPGGFPAKVTIAVP